MIWLEEKAYLEWLGEGRRVSLGIKLDGQELEDFVHIS